MTSSHWPSVTSQLLIAPILLLSFDKHFNPFKSLPSRLIWSRLYFRRSKKSKLEQINNRSLTNTTIRKPSSSPTTTTSVCTTNTKSTTLSRSKSTENWAIWIEKLYFHLICCSDRTGRQRRVETVQALRKAHIVNGAHAVSNVLSNAVLSKAVSNVVP